MLERFDRLSKYSLHTTDKEVGKIADLYFDDSFWTVRYLVVDTGGWLTERSVLVSPYSVTALDAEKQRIDTTLSAERLENSPSPDTEIPVSRQFEEVYSLYYGYPHYWNGPYAWGAYAIPQLMPPMEELQETEGWDSHLQSAKEVAAGYQVEALDHRVGHVADFVIDDADWTIRYLVVDTRDWLPGKHVLLSPGWATAVDWSQRTVSVDVTRDAIEQAPEYHADRPITRDYELELFSHYCKDCYW
jgi:hypothetical protein